MKPYTRKVAAAAILDTTSGLIYTMKRPARHHDIIQAIAKAGVDPKGPHWEQGFTTSDGLFATRKAAAHCARRSGQLEVIPRPAHGLFSEDLW